jgi:hypothetical protein
MRPLRHTLVTHLGIGRLGVGLGTNVRWVDDGVTIASLNGCYDTDWNPAPIKEGEWELPGMIAIIARNREERERKAVIDR